MTSHKKKIEIIDVKLDINLEEEIKKYSNIDNSTKSKVDSILANARARNRKLDPEKKMWDEKFEKLFQIMSNNIILDKEQFIKTLGITADKIAPIISKFKSFLQIAKNNEWVIVLGGDKSRTYTLKRFNASP